MAMGIMAKVATMGPRGMDPRGVKQKMAKMAKRMENLARWRVLVADIKTLLAVVPLVRIQRG